LDTGIAAEIRINASAPAKNTPLTSISPGYHEGNLYYQRDDLHKMAHDIMTNISHKRKAFQFWRSQNIFTYRNDPNGPDGLNYNTESRSGHAYDTERYASTGGYNWTKVDEVYDEVVTRSGIKPIVEFNYMPECMALNPGEVGAWGVAIISPPKDYGEWSDLVRNTVIHFQDRYGVSETRNWYFGVWNEPNHKEFWDFDKYGYDGFIKIYDYSSIPLKEVDNQLQIGGPDNTAVLSFSKQFVEHTRSGTNYANSQTGSPADYFSVHAYFPKVRMVCSEVWKMARDVRQVYGESDYQNKKILITETAPWWKKFNLPFMQNRYTAMWLLGLYDSFLEAADIHGEFYSPKTILFAGLISYFGTRSLMVEVDGNVIKTAPFNLYEMMSMMSEDRLPVEGCDFPSGYLDVTQYGNVNFDQVRCIATRTPGQSIEVMVYHFDQNDRLVYNEMDDGKSPPQPYGTYKKSNPDNYNVDLNLTNIPFANARYRKYVIDKDHSNASAYRAMNGNTGSYSVLNAHDDLEETENKSIAVVNGQYLENLNIQDNSVTLIVIENENPAPIPQLGLSATSLDFGSDLVEMSLTVSNVGTDVLNWSISGSGGYPWITSIDPPSGALNQLEDETVNIKVSRAGLADNVYQGTLSVNSNGGNQDIDIRMTVGTPPLPLSYRINCGGSSYTDTETRLWYADQQYTSGGYGYVDGLISMTTDPIANTADDALYQSERYKLSGYRFDVNNGYYEVVLHFAEIYFTSSGERILDVDIEGNTEISNLDIYAQAGHDAALTFTISDVAVTDNRLDIDFSASSRVTKISAIEIYNIDILDDTEPPMPPKNVKVVIPEP
jgi:hypothetical protein